MAKDSNRHARLREPERVNVSLFERVAQDMGRAFADAADAMFDFAKKYRRLTDDTD